MSYSLAFRCPPRFFCGRWSPLLSVFRDIQIRSCHIQMFLLVFVQCYVVFLQLAISKVYPFHFLIIVFLSDSANWKNCIFVVTHKEIRYLMIKCPKINNIFNNSKFLRGNLMNRGIVELLNN